MQKYMVTSLNKYAITINGTLQLFNANELSNHVYVQTTKTEDETILIVNTLINLYKNEIIKNKAELLQSITFALEGENNTYKTMEFDINA